MPLMTPTPSKCLQVDVGIAAKIKDEIDAKVRQMMKLHPADYDLSAVDVKMTGLAKQGLKAKVFILVKYNCRREGPARSFDCHCWDVCGLKQDIE